MPVLSEIATMTEVAQGTSLARFGDGELLIKAGKDAAHQKFNGDLEDELSCVLESSPCLVGMPHVRGIRSVYWREFLEEYGNYGHETKWFGSAFVSRHDEVPWDDFYRGLMLSCFTCLVIVSSRLSILS